MAQDNLNTVMIVNMIDEGKISVDDLMKIVKLPSLASCLNEMLGKRNLSVEVVSGLADMNKATIHKIMNNKMNPSRDILLRLAFALEMTFTETQVFLKSGNCAALSGFRKRDLFIIEGITHKRTFDEVNEALHQHGFHNLYSKKPE